MYRMTPLPKVSAKKARAPILFRINGDTETLTPCDIEGFKVRVPGIDLLLHRGYFPETGEYRSGDWRVSEMRTGLMICALTWIEEGRVTKGGCLEEMMKTFSRLLDFSFLQKKLGAHYNKKELLAFWEFLQDYKVSHD